MLLIDCYLSVTVMTVIVFFFTEVYTVLVDSVVELHFVLNKTANGSCRLG